MTVESLTSNGIPQWTSVQCWRVTIVVVLMTGCIAFCSSIHTAAISSIARDFGCSRIVATLGITTFLLGFASGPLIFAPLSEIWGRNAIYRSTLLLFVLLNLGCALAPNIAALLVFRFLCGFFGSPTVTNSGGSLIDVWPQAHRSVPLALFTAASFLGPVLAPVVGGFVCQYTSWRWCYWIVTILAGLLYASMLLLLPETYAPFLRKRALSASAANAIPTSYRVTLTRPFIMLVTEPILFMLSLYMAFVYAVLYLDFTAYPIIFAQSRGWSSGMAGLAFLGIGIGMAIATACSPLINRLHTHYTQKIGTVPEARLPHLIPIVWLLPIALFWFGWTSSRDIFWLAPIAAGVPFGLAFVPLFLSITAYLTDCYGPDYAASALAANAVFRSILGAVFPLFATQMYKNLGTPWATSVLGFVAIALAPLPWVFYTWGPWLREKSPFYKATLNRST